MKEVAHIDGTSHFVIGDDDAQTTQHISVVPTPTESVAEHGRRAFIKMFKNREIRVLKEDSVMWGASVDIGDSIGLNRGTTLKISDKMEREFPEYISKKIIDITRSDTKPGRKDIRCINPEGMMQFITYINLERLTDPTVKANTKAFKKWINKTTSEILEGTLEVVEKENTPPTPIVASNNNPINISNEFSNTYSLIQFETELVKLVIDAKTTREQEICKTYLSRISRISNIDVSDYLAFFTNSNMNERNHSVPLLLPEKTFYTAKELGEYFNRTSREVNDIFRKMKLLKVSKDTNKLVSTQKGNQYLISEYGTYRKWKPEVIDLIKERYHIL